MAAKNPLDRIASMLSDEAPERRIAAAIVLGELGHKTGPVVDGLTAMLAQEGPLARHALDAFTRLGIAQKALDRILPLAGSRDPEVREAAIGAVASVGEGVVKRVRARIDEAGPIERRSLESILTKLGGKEAFGALLDQLTQSAEGARSVAVEMRAQIRAADGTTLRSYRAQLEAFLTKHGKDPERQDAVAAAVKVLGYLEDDRTTPLLLAYARDPKKAAAVRQEALIALRFALGKKEQSKVIDALVKAAEEEDRTLAQAAIMTLATLELSPKVAERFVGLARHRDLSRANIAIQKLGSEPSETATSALVEVLTSGDGQRGELASDALRRKLEADAKGVVPLLAKALGEADDPEVARRLKNLIHPHTDLLSTKECGALLRNAEKAIEDGRGGWREAIDVAMKRDPKSTQKILRGIAESLRKKKKRHGEREMLLVLVRADQATNEDRYRLASLELQDSKLDTRPAARQGDAAIRTLERLSRTDYDVVGALRKDRSLTPEQLYYVGFHFVESQSSLGEDILGEVVAKAGRTKIGKAAKNKLKLAEGEA
jgi:hypothetical protein